MKKILLIEDNKEVRENTAEILELAGYTVAAAENGKSGVEMAMKEKPDLIICDIMMPVLDGYGALHLLNKNESTSAIPFIFLTAKAERTDMRKGMEMGADDYITKPFDDIELLNAVESRLKKADAIRRELKPTRDNMNELLGQIKGIHDITKVSDRQQIKHFKKKDVIFTEGDTPQGLYLLNSGKVKICKSHELGKDLIIKLLQPGDFFGYMALLEDEFHVISAEALEDCEVTIFPTEDFYKLLTHPEVMQEFVRLLTGNIQNEQEKLIALAYSSVRKRTAESLLELRARYHDSKSDKPFSMAIAREDLANMVGTATESLIRTLSDFRAEGLIEIHGSNITLANVQKLERMKN
jgi:CRP/FNR family transcriptional regulator, polysaccharide utilization system transcription regulator